MTTAEGASLSDWTRIKVPRMCCQPDQILDIADSVESQLPDKSSLH